MSNTTHDTYKDQLSGLTYKGAPGHVFQLRHVSSVRDMAWCDKRKVWTSPRMGRVYTWDQAMRFSVLEPIPVEGRWYAIGLNLYSVE